MDALDLRAKIRALQFAAQCLLALGVQLVYLAHESQFLALMRVERDIAVAGRYGKTAGRTHAVHGVFALFAQYEIGEFIHVQMGLVRIEEDDFEITFNFNGFTHTARMRLISVCMRTSLA